MKIHITKGNDKLVNIHNISTLPGVDCGKNVPCHRRDGCYAVKFLMYPSVMKAWRDNSDYQRKDMAGYFEAIASYMRRYKPEFFRIHVAGDFTSQQTYNAWASIAQSNPKTKFMAYTKRHEFNFKGRPRNLAILFSYWPGWGDTKSASKNKCRMSFMQDGTEQRVTGNEYVCSGTCENCKVCWDGERDIVFAKH